MQFMRVLNWIFFAKGSLCFLCRFMLVLIIRIWNGPKLYTSGKLNNLQ